MSNSAVDITLLGRTYSIACPQGQEDVLRSIAQDMEQQLSSLKARSNRLSREEIIIMAALNIGHNLHLEKQKNNYYMQQMEDKITLLQTTLERALVEGSTK